jgi:demethoxyubiquinone hydroxylase (CLK1/Coq7/Cat5 family)
VTSPDNERHEPSENKHLHTALEAKEEIIASLKSKIQDLRDDRDQWRDQAGKAARQLDEALTVIKALPAPAKTEEEQPKRKKLWGLF